MWKGQCLSFSGDVDSTAHTIAPPKISAVAKSMESGVHACLRRVERARVLLSLSSSSSFLP